MYQSQDRKPWVGILYISKTCFAILASKKFHVSSDSRGFWTKYYICCGYYILLITDYTKFLRVLGWYFWSSLFMLCLPVCVVGTYIAKRLFSAFPCAFYRFYFLSIKFYFRRKPAVVCLQLRWRALIQLIFLLNSKSLGCDSSTESLVE